MWPIGTKVKVRDISGINPIWRGFESTIEAYSSASAYLTRHASFVHKRYKHESNFYLLADEPILKTGWPLPQSILIHLDDPASEPTEWDEGIWVPDYLKETLEC